MYRKVHKSWVYSLMNVQAIPMEPVSRINRQNIPYTQKCPVSPLWPIPCQGGHSVDLYCHTLLYINGNAWCVVYKSGFFCSN